MFGGDGEAEMHVILKAPEEMYGKGRVFNRVVLAPGSEIAWHVHHGDGECYYVLKGEGTRARAHTATTATSSRCAPAT